MINIKRILGLSIKTFLLIIAFLVFIYGVILIKHAFFFSMEITDNFLIQQVPLKKQFNLIINSDQVINDIDGWIINEEAIYGHFQEKYFFVSKLNHKILLFDDEKDINIHLKELNLNIYDFGYEEGIADLKFGNGRNRKY